MNAKEPLQTSDTYTDDCSLLTVTDIRAGYGDKVVLHSVSLDVLPGEIVTVIGANGSGKSTVLKVIAGLLVCRGGTVEFEGRCMNQLSVRERINAGIVYMPQGNQVFRTLTVRDNLTVSLTRRAARRQRQEIERVVDVLPVVGKHLNRVAGTLSGGEKQQVALAIALMKRPRLLLCDEPSLGLAPNLLDEVFAAVAKASREMMMSVLLVEHKVREAFEICGRVAALQRGAVVRRGSPSEFGDQVLKDVFLT